MFIADFNLCFAVMTLCLPGLRLQCVPQSLGITVLPDNSGTPVMATLCRQWVNHEAIMEAIRKATLV
jgi:hypothetical protein